MCGSAFVQSQYAVVETLTRVAIVREEGQAYPERSNVEETKIKLTRQGSYSPAGAEGSLRTTQLSMTLASEADPASLMMICNEKAELAHGPDCQDQRRVGALVS